MNKLNIQPGGAPYSPFGGLTLFSDNINSKEKNWINNTQNIIEQSLFFSKMQKHTIKLARFFEEKKSYKLVHKKFNDDTKS